MSVKPKNNLTLECHGKHTFPTWERAKVAARVPGVRPYRCRFCDGWHVGHPPGFERRNRRRTGA